MDAIAGCLERMGIGILFMIGGDGTLMAADCRLIAEGGAYLGVGPLNIYIVGTSLNLPYRLPNIRFEGYRVYTNKPICGAVRGQAIGSCVVRAWTGPPGVLFNCLPAWLKESLRQPVWIQT